MEVRKPSKKLNRLKTYKAPVTTQVSERSLLCQGLLKGSEAGLQARRVLGLGFKGLGFKALGFRVKGLGFKVQGLGFRVEGLGFRV